MQIDEIRMMAGEYPRPFVLWRNGFERKLGSGNEASNENRTQYKQNRT